MRVASAVTWRCFFRSRCNQNESISLVHVEGVNTRDNARFYVGKRVAYIYPARTIKHGHKYRVCVIKRCCRRYQLYCILLFLHRLSGEKFAPLTETAVFFVPNSLLIFLRSHSESVCAFSCTRPTSSIAL